MKYKLLALGLLLICTTAFAELETIFSNKKSISLSGKIDPYTKAAILNKNNRVADVTSDSYGNWSIENLYLDEGDNLIKISPFSFAGLIGLSETREVAKVIVDTIPPKLYVSVSPREIKTGESLHISVDANEPLKSCSIVMPDRKQVELAFNHWNGKWEGLWILPITVLTGTYQSVVSANDMASNQNQKDTNPYTLWTKPVLEVFFPPPKFTTYESSITVNGIARDTKLVAVNGRKVYADDKGRFGVNVSFLPGKQSVSVQAINLIDNRVTEINLDVLRLITYPDITEHWARHHIEHLATLGIVDAVGGTGLYAPDQALKRDELAVLLVKLKKTPLVKLRDKISLKDIPLNYWAASYIETGVRTGLISGYLDNSFRPDRAVTRAEATALAVRELDVPKLKVTSAPADDVSTTYWAASDILTGKQHNIIPLSWLESSKFYPYRPVTRAEIAYMLSWVPSVKKDIMEMLAMGADGKSETIDTERILVESQGPKKYVQPTGRQAPEILVSKAVKLPAEKVERILNMEVKEVRSDIFSPLIVPIMEGDNKKIVAKAPELQLQSPQDESVTYKQRVIIRGKGLNCREMFVNGHNVRVDEDGAILTKIDLLHPGKNLITFVAENESGRKTVLNRKVLMLKEFSDVTDQHWAKKLFGSLWVLGYLSPKQTDKFGLYEEISRAEAAELLVKVKHLSLPKLNEDVAKDVFKESSSAPAIKLALTKGIFQVNKSGYLYPYKAITRAEFVKLICNIEDLKLPLKVTSLPFQDVKTTDSLAPYLKTALAQGIITPTSYFQPNLAMLREYGFAMLGKTRLLLEEMRNLYSWYIGFDDKVSTQKERESQSAQVVIEKTRQILNEVPSRDTKKLDIAVLMEVFPRVVAQGKAINVEVKTLVPVENVLVSFPNHVMQQCEGKDNTWTTTWLVPEVGVEPGRYQAEAMVILADGNIIMNLSPEFIVISGGK